MHKDENSELEVSCTWKDESNCMECTIKGNLDCRWEKGLLMRFYKVGSLAMISGFLGLISIGLFVSWIPLIVYLGFWIFFFGFFEIRVLCSHCPYYAEGKKGGRTLHCLANHGTPKLWRYHPEPMRLWEKLGFLGGAIFFVVFPIVAELYGIIEIYNNVNMINELVGVLIILTIGSTIGAIIFLYGLTSKICPKCINFSCPLNRVPKEIVDEYLKKNPVMREAWEKAGYLLD